MDDDLFLLTDDELDAHRRAVLAETERRTNLAAIPGQVADLARTYAAGGGDPADLVAALETTEGTD